MLKRFAALILAVLLLLALCSCERGEEAFSEHASETGGLGAEQSDYLPLQSKATPLFWLVSSQNGAKLWLFGAMLAGDSSIYPLPIEVTSAYSGASLLAVDVNIYNIADASAVSEHIFYKNGEALRDNIDAKLYSDVLRILNRENAYTASCEEMIPAYINTIINQLAYEKAGLNKQYGIDAYFINSAKTDGKTIVEIVSPDEKYSRLAGLSDELQEHMLKTTVAGYENGAYAEDIKTAFDAWKRGDEQLLSRLLLPKTEELGGEQKYYNNMYVEPNGKIADFCACALAENKNAFVCVGLASLLGDDGVVAKLRAAGYTVERVEYQ